MYNTCCCILTEEWINHTLLWILYNTCCCLVTEEWITHTLLWILYNTCCCLLTEEWITHTLLWILFFLSFAVLTVASIYIYCKLEDKSHMCAAWKSDLHYYYMRFKYFYYSHMSSAHHKYG